MNTCASCTHWEQREDFDGEPEKLGKCLAVPMYFDCTEWNQEGNRSVLKPEFAAATAFAQDGSDYRAYLLTTPEHGCTMYQEKA